MAAATKVLPQSFVTENLDVMKFKTAGIDLFKVWFGTDRKSWLHPEASSIVGGDAKTSPQAFQYFKAEDITLKRA